MEEEQLVVEVVEVEVLEVQSVVDSSGELL